MRPSLCASNGPSRLRLQYLRNRNPTPLFSTIIGSRRYEISANESSSSSSSAKVFPKRRQEFARKRALYFSPGYPWDNNDCVVQNTGIIQESWYESRNKIHNKQFDKYHRPWIVSALDGIYRNRDEKDNFVNKPKKVSSSLPPLLVVTAGDGCRRWFSTKTSPVGVTSAFAASLPSRLAYPTVFSPTSRTASSSTPNSETTPKIKMPVTPSNDDCDDEVEGKNSENTAFAAFAGATSSLKDKDSEIDELSAKSDNAVQAATEKEKNWKRVRAIKVPQYGPDADKAVRSLQSARKERARVKTSINVQRALYGNMVICAAKLGAWLSSGSSSMMSEFVHSVVDCGNQALLLVGLRHTQIAANKRHPYGYGKSVYFWALVSALGTFFMGAGVSMSHSVQTLFHPTLAESISNEVWYVLGMSFIIDGYVLMRTYQDIEEARPKGMPMAKYISKLRDPATLAVLMEDGAACLGIAIAIAGIAASHATCNPIYDGIAGVGISCLLAGIGLALVRVNHSFLIGQAVEKDMLDKIEQIIRNRRSIDNVTGIQSQWTGPETFSFKAELDFDGTYLSALLMPRYRAEFRSAGEGLDEDLEVLLSWYAEDVIRAVEREVRHIESVIRQQYPGAEYIELEPMSKYVDRFAIDDSFEEKLLLIEKKELKKWVRVLYENKEENAWRTVTTDNNSSDSESGNIISGSVPTDTLPKSGSIVVDKLEK